MPLVLFAGSRQSLSIPIGRATTMLCQERLGCNSFMRFHFDVGHKLQHLPKIFGQPTYVTDDIRQTILADKNAARNRLLMHQQNCKRFLRNLSPGFPPPTLLETISS